MKTLFKTLSAFLLIVIFCSCNKGPDEEIVKNDIGKHFRAGKCSTGNNILTINDLKIVGKNKKEKDIVFQAVANISEIGPCNSAGTFDYEITTTYEKFGSGWREKEHEFDYKQK